MRHNVFALAAVLLAGAPLVAQNPTGGNPAPAQAQNDPRLDSLLKAWEQKMKGLDRLATECTREQIDGLKGSKQSYAGQAWLLKPNMAMLNLMNTAKPDDRELYISNGNNFYEYKFKEKLVVVHEMPKGEGAAISDDTLFMLLNGMTADAAKARYTLQLEKFNAGEWYIYLRILPKNPADKQEFKEAQMVLWSTEIAKLDPNRADWALLPARLWFKSPSDAEVTWTFTKPDIKAGLKKEHFVPTGVPKDWRVEKAAPVQGQGPAPKGPASNFTVPNPEVPPTKIRQ